MGLSDLAWFFPSAMMGWRNLGRNKLRTALAALGIVIGVVAIASLGMAGAAIQHQATANLASLTDEVTVSSGGANDANGVTEEQVQEIERIAQNAEVVPQRNNFSMVTVGGREQRATIHGIDTPGPLYNGTMGEMPRRLTNGALVGNESFERMNLELGQPIQYDGSLYRIRGVITSETGFGTGTDEIVLPVSAMDNREYYDEVTIIAEDGDTAASIAQRIEQEFNQGNRERTSSRSREEAGGQQEQVLRVRSFGGARENIGGFMNTLNLALWGIGSISLFVASVAILNVMLMSTIERRGEIGVLRAVGITRGEVLRMILAEALFLGVIGGIVGGVLAIVVGYFIFDFVTGQPMLVLGPEAFRHVLTAFGFAVVASVLSGAYPAWKAANDPPVESLRS